MKIMSNVDMVRGVIEEYTTNIVDGSTVDGDFLITTVKRDFLKQLTSRVYKMNWMCTDMTEESNGYCTVRYHPYDEWFDQDWDWMED